MLSAEAALPRIAQLPPAVADAIAAGEVVERPASVVKELCENALDAGARNVDVVAEDAGLSLLQVTDDGCGIDAADLRIAVARNATSKIAGVDDLSRVATLGFRGEALASIAAVSTLTITSRRGDAPAARLRVRGSEALEHTAAAAPRGTTVEVRELFFTTPARLRFLRSDRSEAAAIQRAVSDCALTHPEVAFTCTLDGRTVLRSDGSGVDGALAAVFGAAAAELVRIDGGEASVRVGGAISRPNAHRATRAGLVVAVNGRRVHHRTVLAAVDEACRGLLPAGRYPFGLVALEVDPGDVDVNVHPTKREVRLRDERAVFSAVERACAGALRRTLPAPRWSIGDAAPALTLAEEPPAAPVVPVARPPVVGEATPPPTAVDELSGLRAVGQALDSWIVAESPRGVVVVDQHAAHEKVLYARLRARAEGGAVAPRASQLLLIPELVAADAGQLAALDEEASLVHRLGFELEPFGPGTVRCTAVPATGRDADVARLVGGLLDEIAQGGRGDREHRVCALIACHAAVRLGDALSAQAQQQLLDELCSTPGAATCPHGRPTVLVLDDATLRRAFRRPATG